jgi:hypothetical protein
MADKDPKGRVPQALPFGESACRKEVDYYSLDKENFLLGAKSNISG